MNYCVKIILKCSFDDNPLIECTLSRSSEGKLLKNWQFMKFKFMAAILIFFLQISIENHEMMMWEENTKWNKINVLSFFSPQPLPEFSVVICTRFSCLRMYMEREFRDVFQKKSNRHIAPDTLWNSLFQNTINSEPVKTNTNRTFCEHNFYFS